MFQVWRFESVCGFGSVVERWKWSTRYARMKHKPYGLYEAATLLPWSEARGSLSVCRKAHFIGRSPASFFMRVSALHWKKHAWACFFLAGIAGLEPANAGVKVLCLTDLAISQYLICWIRKVQRKWLYHTFPIMSTPFCENNRAIGALFHSRAVISIDILNKNILLYL